MSESLTAHQRRVVAVGILFLVAASIVSLTVLPVWLVNSHYQGRVDEMQYRLQRFERIADQDQELRSRFSELRSLQSARGHLLQGESEAAAAADMQRILKEIAEVNGTRLMSTQILPARKKEGDSSTQVTLRIRARGSLPSIVRSIHQLEASPVLLFLDSLSLRTVTNRSARFRTPSTQFEADFDLIGYLSEVQ